MFVVIDGATSGPSGEKLAHDLGHLLVDRFIDANPALSPSDVSTLLQSIHADLRLCFPADSASYLILLQSEPETFHTIHSGDCRLGIINGDENIDWVCRPHCLANAIYSLSEQELRAHGSRHLLTQSFRARQFIKPEVNQHACTSQSSFIMATDGFWAELDEIQQIKMLHNHSTSTQSPQDDRSYLILHSGSASFSNSNTIHSPATSSNFYLKTTIPSN
jgi:serine/threonine protein phosphatase PrpC